MQSTDYPISLEIVDKDKKGEIIWTYFVEYAYLRHNSCNISLLWLKIEC